MKENTQLKNGIKIHCIQDDKFQSVYGSIKIMFKMAPVQNTCANVLAQMMSDRLETELSKKDIAQRLDLLYGAKMGSTTYSMGTYQVIDLSVVAIADHFVDTQLFQAQIELLADMLYKPLLNQATFDEAVKNLRLNHNRIKENPSQYAIIEGFKAAGENQIFALTAMGNLGDLETLRLDDVIQLHKDCVDTFAKVIYFVGPLAEKADFSRFERGSSAEIKDALLDTKISPQERDVMYRGNQTELVLIYETDITPLSPDYAAYLVFIAHLGQLPSSLLFQNVREKHSLCYSIYASRQIFDGIFYIATGINDANRTKALDLIQEQISTCQNDIQDITAAKKYLSMQMEGVGENQKSISSHYFRNEMLNVESSIEAIQENINNVSAEDVLRVAQSVNPAFIYSYRGESHEEN